ncbi:MAG: hypothetical protein WDM96_13180 [Lacunisphaera sp.]
MGPRRRLSPISKAISPLQKKSGDQPAATAPADWAARHNLGLALAQQDRWAEATAHWTSAALLNARADATRWDLALGLQRSGLANPELVELSRGEGAFRVARLATPGEWQLALIGAALLLAVGLVVVLLQGYKRIGGWGVPTRAGRVACRRAARGRRHVQPPRLWPAGRSGRGVLCGRRRPSAACRRTPTRRRKQPRCRPAPSPSPRKPSSAGQSSLSPGGQSGWVRTETLVALYR